MAVETTFNLKPLNNESEEGYIWRLGRAKDKGEINLSWDDVAALVNSYYRESEDCFYESSAYRKPYQQALRFYKAGCFDIPASQTLLKIKTDLEKERKKIQTEKVEYNKFLREDARDELIIEAISEAISNMEPLPSPNRCVLQEPETRDDNYLLAFGDCHFGIEFDIKNLAGDSINSYSEDIFYERMNKLFQSVVDLIESNGIESLDIFELGDAIQGILRLDSQLMKLKYGVIESTVKYACYIADWLNALSEYTHIRFHMVVDSNHNQLRICGAKKNAFTEENMSKVILVILKERLKNNNFVEIVENPTGMAYAQISGYSILGIHGEVKDLEKSLSEFSVAYDSKIDYLIGAHCHHRNQKEVGANREVLTVPSVIGVDPYGLSLRKTSKPGASLFGFRSGEGKFVEYSIDLK